MYSLQNYSTVFGGGVIIVSSKFNVLNSAIIGNYAGKGGGAIKVLGGTVNTSSTTISFNKADDYGAAFDITTQGMLSSVKTNVYISESNVSGNSAKNRGAALFLDAVDDIIVSDSVIYNNSGKSKTRDL